MASIVPHTVFLNKILFKHCLQHSSIHFQLINAVPLLNFKPIVKYCHQNVSSNEEENLGKIVDLSESYKAPIYDFNKRIKREVPKPNNKEDSKLNKLEANSKLLSNYLVNVKSKKKREKSGLVLLEGKRLVQDALDADAKPVAIFYSRISDVESLNIKRSDVQLFNTSYKDLKFWSDVMTTQGILGIFKMPDTRKKVSKGKLPFTIICDNVRDPGNMGSIIRTAAAVGCEELILTKGCVDIWEPKVLRSGAGSHFRLRIHSSLTWSDISNHIPATSRLLLADSDVPEPVETEREAVVVYELSNDGEKIPIKDEPDKRITSYQNKTVDKNRIPLVLYTAVNYLEPESLVLIIGGETEGLNEEAYKLAMEREGRRVYIPLDNGVESLNSGIALGVISYEIRRQKLATS